VRLAPLLALALVLTACGGKHAAAKTVGGCTVVSQPKPAARKAPRPTAKLDPAASYDVRFRTNCGSFTVALAVKESPKTAASFASLVRHGFFDGTIFHRIVPGFVIQGGDPTASGLGGPGYTVVEAPPAGTRYTAGLVAMAKAGNQPRGASGSQFFVVTAKDAHLTADYAVVGRVVAGMNVVLRIGRLGDANENPTAIVEIEKATLTVH
jgi:cyclophilin family peptidyl-prolyl cis-trans isomerase